MARRGSSKRNMPNGSTSTRQTRTSIDFATTRQPSFASSVSEAGWPKGSVANLSGGAASKEEVGHPAGCFSEEKVEELECLR
eukprot:1157267-Pelagomonas_calceolata.AAC.1